MNPVQEIEKIIIDINTETDRLIDIAFNETTENRKESFAAPGKADM